MHPSAVTKNQATGKTYSYDANGNMTVRGTQTLTWDFESRVTSVSIGTSTTSMEYDYTGMRVKKWAPGSPSPTQYPFAGYEIDAGGTITKVHPCKPDRNFGQQIIEAVCGVMGVDREEIRQPKRSEQVQRSRELVCYMARRYGEIGLPELARFLRVKEWSTASHAVRRATERLKEDPGFRCQTDRALKKLSSSMQA